MELLDLPQLAERTSIPLSLARYYRDRFIMFVPSVRIGRALLHPLEAAGVLQTIRDHGAAGLSADAIEAALADSFPVTVITSQEVPAPGVEAGALSAMRALANTLDERGVRLEAEVAKLRVQIASTASATQLQTALFESRILAETTSDEVSAELGRVKSSVEELRTKISLLASREQLEWIGDVVAAAALQPPRAAVDTVIAQRLQEIQGELQQPRPLPDMVEMRVAIDRIGEHVFNRDQEVHRAFQTLVSAMRHEIGAMRSALADLKRTVRERSLLADAPVAYESIRPNGHSKENGAARFQADAVDEPGQARAPRRLGQQPRPGRPSFVDDGGLQDAD
jgi:hypothetical protein